MAKLNEDAQFVPTDELLTQILAEYSIGPFTWHYATSGIENLTLILSTVQQNYVLRVYRQGKKTASEIHIELDFLAYLKAQGLPVVPPLKNRRGDVLTAIRDKDRLWHCLLMPFINGSHPEAYTPELLDEMATIQGHLHLHGLCYSKVHEFSGTVHDLSCYYAPDFERAKYPAYHTAFLETAQAFRLDVARLPAALVHLDYDAENILVKGASVLAVLDFDDIAQAPLVACLGNTLWDVFLATGSESALRDYLAVYSSIRSLSESESNTLPSVMLLRHYSIALLSATVWNVESDEIEALRVQADAIQRLNFSAT